MKRLILSLLLITILPLTTGLNLIPVAHAQFTAFETNPAVVLPIEALGANLPGIVTALGGTFIASGENAAADSLNLANMLWQWAKDLYNDVLRRQILNYLVQQIINYINGTGDGKFISDWNGFLDGLAGTAIEAFSKDFIGINLCSPFSIQLKLSLVNVPSFDNKFTCTLTEVISNIDDFRNDFRNGEWLAYGSAFEPNNNFYGAYLKLNFERSKTIYGAKSAGLFEGISGNGFLGTKQCDEGPAPTANAADELNAALNDQSPDVPLPGRDIDGDGKLNDIASSCRTVTPGATIGALAGKALGSDIDYVISAKELTAYVTAIANAVFNRVLTEGLSALQSDDSDIGGYVDLGRIGREDQQNFSAQRKNILASLDEAIASRVAAQITIDRTSSTLSLASIETAKAALIYLQAEFAKVETTGDLQRRENTQCEAFSEVWKIRNRVLSNIEDEIFNIEDIIATIEIADDDDPVNNPDNNPEDNADIIAILTETRAELAALTENTPENREALVAINTELGSRFTQEARKFRGDIQLLRKSLSNVFELVEKLNQKLDFCTDHPPTTPMNGSTIPSTPFPWE